MSGGGTDRREVEHVISLDGTTVCRDGRPVKVVGFKRMGSLRVGCTVITQEAMLRLFDLYARCEGDEVLQKGHE